MFSAAKQFRVPVISGTRKEAIVRYPTDGEWCERSRRQRSIRRFLGRGKTQAEEVDTSSVNLDLFNRIRHDKEGVAFTASEAGAVLAKLERAEVVAVEREADNFRIRLKVPGAETVHVVRLPLLDEMEKHEASSMSVIGQRRSQEIRGFLEPSGELYDAISKGVEGYEGPVPIVHKVAIVAEVLAQVAADDEEALPE